MKRIITEKTIADFRLRLIEEEKSVATVRKYVHDVRELVKWLPSRKIDKNAVIEYKSYLITKHTASSVNAALASINSFFSHNEWFELRVKSLKIQRKIFTSDDTELTKEEYLRLLEAVRRKNVRLFLLMQTICSTGIRVSELKFVTVDAVEKMRAEIQCKGKFRTVFLPEQLSVMLMRYVREQKINSGPVFITKNGNPLDRSNIWSDMKRLCRAAGVPESKVFPHNLRHLFARTYYSIQKDIVRLADILGHSSVNTTRIYTMETGDVHQRQIQKLGLLRL